VAAVCENELVASPVLYPYFHDFIIIMFVVNCRRPVSTLHVDTRSRPPSHSRDEANRLVVALIITLLVCLDAVFALLGCTGVVVPVAVATRDGCRIAALRVHCFALAHLVIRVIALLWRRRWSLGITRTQSGIFRDGRSNGHSCFFVPGYLQWSQVPPF